MKVLGIPGSPRKDYTTEKLVKEVLAGAEGVQTEFISLAGKKINPCIACLKCAGDNVCVVNDDMKPLAYPICIRDDDNAREVAEIVGDREE